MTEWEQPPRPERNPQVEKLLVGAVDLHCHSGPAIFPRVLDHHEQMVEAGEAGFKAVVFKDHYYLGTPTAMILEKLFPELGVKLFSGIVLNNAMGGINPFAVHHAVQLGAKIIWMPTFSARNHIEKTATAAKGFPKVAGTPDPIPLSPLDDNGALTDDTKKVLDLIAMGDIILASGHLHKTELYPLFEEAKARGVKKMIITHPSYLIDCQDEDLRSFASMGVILEQETTLYVPGRGQKTDAKEAYRVAKVAGIESTIFCSDLGLQGSAFPVDGFRLLIGEFLEMGVPEEEIKTMFGKTSAGLLNLD